MMERYELIIKKSKFYSYIFTIQNSNDIKILKENIKKENKKATHICYGYVYKNDNQLCSGFDDDGEPSGTAGRPIKELMIKRNVMNKVIFVVRYFGGIKLGGGGLIRSYVKSANLAIENTIEK